jgi:alpha-amylase/alpha-mannosidase (GH57 family)
VHGHFYQPPRENPWLDAIDLQPSATPYHDWNARITAECYAPNTAARILDEQGRIQHIINNYAWMSFNVGPTLMRWLAQAEPVTYAGILAADKEGQARFGGHGPAIGQAYGQTSIIILAVTLRACGSPRRQFVPIRSKPWPNTACAIPCWPPTKPPDFVRLARMNGKMWPV